MYAETGSEEEREAQAKETGEKAPPRSLKA